MNTFYMAMSRDYVLQQLAHHWPPTPGTPILRLADDVQITDGAAVVYPQPGQPGYSWWVVDRTIPRQEAGTPSEELAALLPGSVLETVPEAEPEPEPEPHPNDDPTSSAPSV
ncbi:hypothetical protein ACFSJS_22555 [Streptomyces desertarenae]|uniref:Uncharacterized protein n=1 Tax=Streptomyces desertarenae TaxID=2666184 RepID=A0ABW4PQX3_9ACTN